jgi:hypothetical protein
MSSYCTRGLNMNGTENPRSRGTDSLDVFLPGGRFMPRVVKAKRITAHQVRLEESNHMRDCCLVSSHSPPPSPHPVALCRAFWRGSNGAVMQENPRWMKTCSLPHHLPSSVGSHAGGPGDVSWSVSGPRRADWLPVVLRRRLFIPRPVEAERITDHEMMGVNAIRLLDCCVVYLYLHYRHRRK